MSPQDFTVTVIAPIRVARETHVLRKFSVATPRTQPNTTTQPRGMPSVVPSTAGSIRRDTQSAQQIQPVRQTSEGYSGKSKTDLTVLTAEGDRVTISLAAQVKYAASSQTGPGGSSQPVASSTSSQLRVAVEGDLNEAELKDLGTPSAPRQSNNQAISQTPSTETVNPFPGGCRCIRRQRRFPRRSRESGGIRL